MNNKRKLIKNCSQLITCQQTDSSPKRGKDFQTLALIEKGALVVNNEKIEWVGKESELEANYRQTDFEETIDAEGRVVTPGLVDAHTHPVFAATRENEFYLRNAGKSYMEIAEAGGGIRNSVRKLRTATADDLYKIAVKNLQLMLKNGTTTIEAKSGYGLTTEAEIKSLEVIKKLNDNLPLDIYATFLGAHDFPDEYRDNRQEYIRILVEEMIPKVSEQNLAQYCDIFTEVGVFDIEQSRQVMTAAKKAGMELRFHADELKSLGGAELAVELDAKSADHLVHISEKGIEMLAGSNTVAVLLPATTFFLGHDEYAPARKMIDSGVIVALATDFNPGSSCTLSLQTVMTVAAVKMRLSAEECLNAVTYNAAYSLGLADKIGSLTAGKQADFVIWDVENYQQIPYYFGQNLVINVYKKGREVF